MATYRPALFYRKLGGGVECRLCAHYCRLDPGQTGLCRVRHNRGGELFTSAWGRPAAMMVEPIEKKYLFHVLPGTRTLSLGTAGCNLGCDYCINWRISQTGVDPSTPSFSPAEVVRQALAGGASSIALTYTEPTIFFEYAERIALRARRAGLRVVAKSNGYMAPAVLERMAGWLDAINIDLKGLCDASHRRALGGALAPVLDNLRLARRLGLWLEVSTLVVPDWNDSDDELRAMARFISAELGREIPWHLLRFFPHHRRLTPPTSQDVLRRAARIAREEGLVHVYNKELERGRMFDTFCPRCRARLLERQGFRLTAVHLADGRCRACGHALGGVGLDDSNLGGPHDEESCTSEGVAPVGALRRASARLDELGRL